ncbi:MAG: hypothetical protein K0B16_18010 [Burkholderiaceae bacterium]|nr:hypothetical protein [Burkholderiaceae bacterium]
MIIDSSLMFSDKQDVSATEYSTNTLEIPPGLYAGIDMALQIVVRSESGTDPTLLVELETSADNATFAKLVGVPKPAGERVFNIRLHGLSGLKKYLRLRYVPGGAAPNYNITAMLVEGGGFSSAQSIQNIAARGQE